MIMVICVRLSYMYLHIYIYRPRIHTSLTQEKLLVNRHESSWKMLGLPTNSRGMYYPGPYADPKSGSTFGPS